MADMTDLPHLVIVVGPTAVGKTSFAIDLALRLNAEIISADSRLFYREMDIGTAKPSLDERKGVPHHLIDVADPTETWSLQRFQETAAQIIADVYRRGRLPLLVGGTGQYVRAVVEGWQGPTVPPNPALRSALEAWAGEIGTLGLHERLTTLDPAAAHRIDHQNLRRTVRALEVIFLTGKRFSDQRQQDQKRYQTLTFGLQRPRAALYERIDQRIEAMFAAGFVDEVANLLSRGYPIDLPTFSAIGYREVIAHLSGEISLEEAKLRMRRQTRVFVRRQANWFNLNDPEITWLSAADLGEPQASATLTAAVDAVRIFLAKP
jgi:tRNA dimethylallyltransferase